MMDDAAGLVVFPERGAAGSSELGAPLRACAERYLCRLGSILFRGFAVDGEEALWSFAAGFGQPLCSDPGTPVVLPRDLAPGPVDARSRLGLQHLAAVNGGWPSRLWLHAAARAGGVRLADGREVFRNVPSQLRARFIDRGLQYVSDVELPVQLLGAAGAAPRGALEQSCRARGLSCEWLEDGRLRTRRLAPAVIAHPVSRELVWFNQAHLFADRRARCRGTSARRGGVRAEAALRERVLYADGREIEAGALEELCAVYERVERVHDWEAGDVLLLDNLSVAHAELPDARPAFRFHTQSSLAVGARQDSGFPDGIAVRGRRPVGLATGAAAARNASRSHLGGAGA